MYKLTIHGETDNPFPALQELTIDNLKILKTWSFPKGCEKGFSLLKELTIFQCDELTEIPGCFPSLTNLHIHRCPNLRSLASIGNLLFLREVSIEGLDSLGSLDENFYGESRNPFPSLESLRMVDMRILSKWCFPGGDRPGFCSLKELVLDYCPELTDIPYCFPRLINLELTSCSNLVGLTMPDAKEESVSSSTTYGPSLRYMVISVCGKFQEIQPCFVNLEKAKIGFCKSLTSVPGLQLVQSLDLIRVPFGVFLPTEAAVQNFSLKELIVESSSSTDIMELLSKGTTLTRFTSLKRLVLKDLSEETNELEEKDVEDSVAKVPLSLSYLSIRGGICRKILPEACKLKFLTNLKLSFCQSLESLPDIETPSELKSLKISAFRSLRTIPDRFLLGCRRRLEKLSLNDCSSLAHLPKVFLTLESLLKLSITGCDMLKSLPDGFHNTASLQTLKIEFCPNLSPPEDGFPTTITTFSVYNCGKMDPVSKMKLSKLTSLKILYLRGFPETTTLDNCIPDSVEYLIIKEFPRLKSVSGVLPALKQLKVFRFEDCPLLLPKESKSWSKKLKGITKKLNDHSTFEFADGVLTGDTSHRDSDLFT